MSAPADGKSPDADDLLAEQLKQRIAEVRRQLEAASDQPPDEGPGLMELAHQMDRLIVQYTRLSVERKRRGRH